MSELRDSLIDFLDDPRAFMASNIVIPPSAPHNKTVFGTGSGIFQFSWARSDRTGKRLGNLDCPIYRVEKPDAWNSGLPRFMAYYCHYDSDNIFDLMLAHEMKLMLTPRMDGCSFGIGSETATGERRVAHANVSRTESTAEGIARQGRDQASLIGNIIPSARVFGPTDYLDADVSGTTVGVSDGRHWSFFMQIWKRPTSTSYILDRIEDFG